MRSTSLLFLALLASCAGAQPDADDAPRPLFLDDDDQTQDLIGEIGAEQLTDHVAGIGLEAADFTLMRTHVDPLGVAHARFQQQLDGVPVFGGEAIVHLGEDGRPAGITDDLVRDVFVDVAPAYDAQEAIELALPAGLARADLTAPPRADLWVLRHEDVDHLAWRVRLERLDGTVHTSQPVVFVDAHSGEPIWSYEGLRTASGSTDYYGTVSFGSYNNSGTYYLEDTSRNMGTYTYNNTTSSLYYVTDTDDSWTDTADRQAVTAHWGLARTLDYYSNNHGRSGIDGSNGPGYISSLAGTGGVQSMLVNYGTSYVNAFWDGTKMVIGDGDGTTSGPLTSLDIVGHELTHGVVENEANLTYANESGALNESYADVFGALVELEVQGAGAARWWIGETCWTPGTSGDALRYMNDPTADGSSRDHYSTRYTGTADSGGVHWNSGIANLAFYLLVNGGSHPNASKSVTTVTGIGAADAADIWYLALTSYMTSSTNFAGARTATLSAASSLYGSSSAEYASVQDAWAEVGVGSPSGGGGGGGGGGGAYCSGYATNTSGSLSGSGASAAEPGGTYYYSGSGTHAGCLDGPSGSDFDLEIYKWQSGRWRRKAAATTSSADETLSYTGTSGYYYWRVSAYSGGGAYSFGLNKP
jgi:Zn-dependent metalloprotease